MVTINDSPFTRELFKGCQIEATESRVGIANNRVSNATFRELIITP
jgi:hypothetical protein